MTELKRALPEYRTPPVSEVVLGVEFSPLTKWHLGHFGMLHEQVASEYPKFEVHPIIRSSIEKFGSESWQQVSNFELLDVGEVRCWYIAQDDSRLVQVQRDRFIVNWRKRNDAQPYPRYEAQILPTFKREWSRYGDFLSQQGIEIPEVRQCEVTYVNDIPRGQGWDKFSDVMKLITPLREMQNGKFLPEPETLRATFTYVMPPDRGRLHVNIHHVRRSLDEAEVIQLRLTARGAPRSGGMQDVIEWLDSGREWVVRGFTDFTTKEAHDLWERTQ